MGKLEGRVAMITGASRGIGRAIAKRFAEEGATVVAVARTQGALEELDDEIQALGGQCVLVPEDIRDAKKVEQIAVALYERFKKLDILVGNAALLGPLGPMGHLKPKMWDDVMSTNVTANWHLLRYMDPLLRQSDAGRAIFLTSSVGSTPRAYWGAYAVSKAALEMMVKTYAQEIEKTNLRVNLYDPGGTRTRMRESAYPGENPETLPPPEAHGDNLVMLASADCALHGETVRFKK